MNLNLDTDEKKHAFIEQIMKRPFGQVWEVLQLQQDMQEILAGYRRIENAKEYTEDAELLDYLKIHADPFIIEETKNGYVVAQKIR